MLTSSSWRDDALNDALLGESESESADRLLRAIRQHTPQAATLVMEANRHQLHMFFATHTTDYVPLTQGTQLCHERDALVPYLGWYGAQWQPDPDTPPQMIELVLTPTGNPDGLVILSALAAAALHAFAAALQVFVIRPQGRTLRYSANWKSAPDMDAELGKVTWDDLVLPPAMLAGLREAMKNSRIPRPSAKASR